MVVARARGFHTGWPRLPERWLTHLAARPPSEGVTLLALAPGSVVGVGEYAVTRADPAAPDLAVLVVDVWQQSW